MYKGIAKLTRRIKEATTETDITSISEDFKNSEKAVDATEAAVKEMLTGYSTLLQPNPSNRAKFSSTAGMGSRLTGGGGSQKYPQQEFLLSTTMEKHANTLDSADPEGLFGKVIRNTAATYRHVSEARDDLDFEVKQKVFESWSSLLNMSMKEIKDGRNKLNSRRVFYDHLREKQMKGGQNSGVTQMEVEQAQKKLEDTINMVDVSMDNVIQQDTDRVAQLKNLIEAQAAYYEKSANLFRQLGSSITTSINEHTPRSAKNKGPTLMNNSVAMNSNGMMGFNSNQQFSTDFNSFGGQSSQNQQNMMNNNNNNINNNNINNNNINNNNQNLNNANTSQQNNQSQVAFNQNNFGQNNDPWGSSSGTSINNNQPVAQPRNPSTNANFDPWGGSSSSVPTSNVASSSNQGGGNFYALPPATDSNNDPFNLGSLSDPLPVMPSSQPANTLNQSTNKPCCKALYDFEPEQPGELRFKMDDIIELTNKIDDNWYEGRLNGNTGHFPINYVSVITPL